MSIDIGIGSSLSNGEATHFAATTDAITAAMQQVRELHAAYSWARTDEIRCRGCHSSLEIPILASTAANADKALAAHQSALLDALLASADGATAA